MNELLLMLATFAVAYVGAGYMPMLQTLIGGLIPAAGVRTQASRWTAEQTRVYKALSKPNVEGASAQISLLAVGEVKGCFVRFFYYPATNLVKRSLWLPSGAAAKKLHAANKQHQIMPLHSVLEKEGLAAMRRLSMPDMTLEGTWGSNAGKLCEQTKRECKELLAALEDVPKKPVARKSAVSKEQPEAATMTDLPQLAAPSFSAASGNVVHDAKPAPIGDAHVGKMTWHGYASFPDSQRTGKTFACYAMDILYEDDTKNRLRGADLQRAIEEAGINRNDRIKAYKVKELEPNVTKQQNDEPHRGKILWHIEKL